MTPHSSIYISFLWCIYSFKSSKCLSYRNSQASHGTNFILPTKLVGLRGHRFFSFGSIGSQVQQFSHSERSHQLLLHDKFWFSYPQRRTVLINPLFFLIPWSIFPVREGGLISFSSRRAVLSLGFSGWRCTRGNAFLDPRRVTGKKSEDRSKRKCIWVWSSKNRTRSKSYFLAPYVELAQVNGCFLRDFINHGPVV
jgi:hypothetical protein